MRISTQGGEVEAHYLARCYAILPFFLEVGYKKGGRNDEAVQYVLIT